MIINNRLIPFGKSYIAINLFGIIFAKERLDASAIRHEKIHTCQQREMLFVGFFVWYVVEWLVKLIAYRNQRKAYRNISFEREAYSNDHNENYLKMRKHFAWKDYLCLSAFFAFLCVSSVYSQQHVMQDTLPGNPIITHAYSADPSAHVFNDTLWVYPSHDKDDALSFSMEDYHVYSTTDMVNWEDWGVIFNPTTQTSWAKEAAWAPDCIERNGKYYLYYPTDKRHIGVAVGDTPHGPFHDPLGHPLISIDTPGVICDRDFIDPCVFIDSVWTEDGQLKETAYLFMGQNTVCAVKLNDDMISYDKTGGDHGVYIIKGVHEFFEAVWVHKRNGVYYMSYSDGPFFGHEPQISYCTSSSPLGPYTYQGVILDPVNSGTNHHSIVNYKGQDYLFYHTADISRVRRPNFHCGVRRSVCVDKLYYDADGKIRKVAPTINREKVNRAARLSDE